MQYVIAMLKEGLHEESNFTSGTEQQEEAMRLQDPQLKLLYTLGVAQMIEQEVKVKIPPLVFKYDSTQPPKVDLKRTHEMTKLRLKLKKDLFIERWTLNTIPQPTDNGLFNTTLQIRACRVTNQQVKGFTHTFDSQSVLIEFTQDKQLKVVGNKTTFEGDLATVNDERLERVQAGIKEAFSNPHIISGIERIFLHA